MRKVQLFMTHQPKPAQGSPQEAQSLQTHLTPGGRYALLALNAQFNSYLDPVPRSQYEAVTL